MKKAPIKLKISPTSLVQEALTPQNNPASSKEPLFQLSQINEMITQLSTRWPACFNVKAPRPLMKGIHKIIGPTLQESGPFNRALLKHPLRTYVNDPLYLQAIMDHSHRVGLEGQEAEPLTEKDTLDAQRRLETLQAENKDLSL